MRIVTSDTNMAASIAEVTSLEPMNILITTGSRGAEGAAAPPGVKNK